jgi:hypothetical protein
VIDSQTCNIFLSTLTAAPYSLELNESVVVKVVSVNLYGDSADSSTGNGAIIWLVPDAPVSLANDAAITDGL